MQLLKIHSPNIKKRLTAYLATSVQNTKTIKWRFSFFLLHEIWQIVNDEFHSSTQDAGGWKNYRRKPLVMLWKKEGQLVQAEGSAVSAIPAADLVVDNILDALDLLRHPLHLNATLRSWKAIRWKKQSSIKNQLCLSLILRRSLASKWERLRMFIYTKAIYKIHIYYILRGLIQIFYTRKMNAY